MTQPQPDPAHSAQPTRRSAMAQLYRKGALLLVMLVGGIGTTAWLTHAGVAPPAAQTITPRFDRPSGLSHVKSWGYQLQNLDIAKAAAAPIDLLVIDRSALDYGPRDWASRTLNQLKNKPGVSSKRFILAYLSIGEAEDYRQYWQRDWVTASPAIPGTPTAATVTAAKSQPLTTRSSRSRLRLFASRGFRRFIGPAINPLHRPAASAPKWLGKENSVWRGNYHVRFWQPAWKATILGSPASALDNIIAAGFDGVYLDRADVYEAWRRERPRAANDMIAFIVELTAYARRKNPDFVIVLQNAEELARDKTLRNAIDAIAKEDLFYGLDGANQPNSSSDIETALRYLKLVQQDGRPVLTVEYVNEPSLQNTAKHKMTSLGFIPYFGPRELDDLRVKF